MGALEISFGDGIIGRRLWLGASVFSRMFTFPGGMDKRLHEMILKFIGRVIEMVLISDVELLVVVFLHMRLLYHRNVAHATPRQLGALVPLRARQATPRI